MYLHASFLKEKQVLQSRSRRSGNVATGRGYSLSPLVDLLFSLKC